MERLKAYPRRAEILGRKTLTRGGPMSTFDLELRYVIELTLRWRDAVATSAEEKAYAALSQARVDFAKRYAPAEDRHLCGRFGCYLEGEHEHDY